MSKKQNDNDQAKSEARAWHVLLLSGDATEADRDRFRIWLRVDQRNAEAFHELDAIWMSLDLIDDIETLQIVDEENEPAAHANNPMIAAWRSAGPRRSFVLAGIGAIIAGATGFAIIAQHAPVSQERYATRTGEIRTVVLADGSTVTLGAESIMTVQLSKKHRDVSLEVGRGYFDVEPNQTTPFRVTVGATEVMVLGTEFEVNRGDANVRIAVAEGLVEVGASAQTDEIRQQLSAGQGVLATLNGQVSAQYEVDAAAVQTWRSGRLSYVDVRLSDIITDVNRHRREKVIIQDPVVGELRITASFAADKSDAFLKGLEISEPIRLDRSSGQVAIVSEE